MKKKIKNTISYPYSKWITFSKWKKLDPGQRKSIVDLVKLQTRLSKYYKKLGYNRAEDEYINMNAEIEYLKSIGEH